MKRLGMLMLAAMMLLSLAPAARAEEELASPRRETVLSLKGPVYWVEEAERLPNGNLVFHYIVDQEADPVFGLYERRLALIAPDGAVLLDQHWGNYDEDSLFASDDAWQFVIGEGSFTREYYWEPSWDRQSWAQWDWDGTLISGSREAEILSDGDKRLVTNLYPFRMEDYCFGNEDSDPAVRNHGKLIYLPEGTEAECPMGQYFQTGGEVFSVSGLDGEPLVLRRYDKTCRETLALTLPLKENEYVQAILPGPEGPVLVFQQQTAAGEPNLWQETRRACLLRGDELIPLPWCQQRLIDREALAYQDPLAVVSDGVICIAYRWAGIQKADSRLIKITDQGEEKMLCDPGMNVQYARAEDDALVVLGLDTLGRQARLAEYPLNP